MSVRFIPPTHYEEAVNALVKYCSRPERPLCLLGDGENALKERIMSVSSKALSGNSGQTHPLIVPTSGSTTGSPDLVVIDHGALRASADATHEWLGGAGQWITALPLRHIAGIQTVLRSTVAGFAPVVALDQPFEASAFAETVRDARRELDPAVPLYASLVSAQLVDCVEAGGSNLDLLDAVLVGGGFVSDHLIEQAQALGVRVVRTYGMTETSGGCVYNGQALPGVELATDKDGRVCIAGPVLMRGYLDTPSEWLSFRGRRWLRTTDLGTVSEAGLLTVTGRAGDIIKSGGIKVNLAEVRGLVQQVVGLQMQVHALALSDIRWGEKVALLLANGEPNLLTAPALEQLAASIRQEVRATLGPAAMPRTIVMTEVLPTTSLGKTNSAAAKDLVEDAIRQGSAWRR